MLICKASRFFFAFGLLRLFILAMHAFEWKLHACVLCTATVGVTTPKFMSKSYRIVTPPVDTFCLLHISNVYSVSTSEYIYVQTMFAELVSSRRNLFFLCIFWEKQVFCSVSDGKYLRKSKTQQTVVAKVSILAYCNVCAAKNHTQIQFFCWFF